MRRPSLRSQLNQIRLWLRQGRTDAWIAHKLDVSREQLEQFKREHVEGQPAAPEAAPALSAQPPPAPEREAEEAPVRADEIPSPSGGPTGFPPGEDDELGELRADVDRAPAEEPESLEDLEAAAPPPVEEPAGDGPRRRRRRRRGGRRRRGRTPEYEATLDHGQEGYELRLDPAIAENPVYAEHWAGHRSVKVTIAAETIMIRRAGVEGEEDSEAIEGEEDSERVEGEEDAEE